MLTKKIRVILKSV